MQPRTVETVLSFSNNLGWKSFCNIGQVVKTIICEVPWRNFMIQPGLISRIEQWLIIGTSYIVSVRLCAVGLCYSDQFEDRCSNKTSVICWYEVSTFILFGSSVANLATFSLDLASLLFTFTFSKSLSQSCIFSSCVYFWFISFHFPLLYILIHPLHLFLHSSSDQAARKDTKTSCKFV